MASRSDGLDPDLRIPVGTETVAASRYPPTDGTGSHPVILVATPYRKDDAITYGSWDPSIQYFRRRGYEVAVADLLGTGASSGDGPPFHRSEGNQLATVVEWIADREWSAGAVGMFGLSYGAWTQYATAAVNPEPLKAIVPVAVSNSVFESSCPGGVFNPMKRATWPTKMQTMRALPPARRDGDGRWRSVWRDRLDALERTEPWLFRFLAHEEYGDFWRKREVNPEEITVPTFAACGYRDAHTAPMVEFFDGIEAPKRLLLGPWRHRMPEQGRECAVDFRRQATDWFDRFLKERADTSTEPPVAYWTERDGGWKPGSGTWRQCDRWPTHRRSATRAYALTSRGLVEGEPDPGDGIERSYDVDHTVGVESLDRVGRATNVGVPTNGDDARSLVFETEPLGDSVEWTGTGRATVRVRSESPDLLLAARVSDVDPDGTARLVTAGHVRASVRDGYENPRPLERASPTPIRVPLKPKSHVFEPDHRMRIAISGGYFPKALPLRSSGRFGVVSTRDSPSTIAVPGRTHEDGVRFDDRLDLSEPDRTVPTESRYVSDRTANWSVDRTHSTDEVTLKADTAKTIDLPYGPTLRTEQTVEAAVAAADPETATVRTDATAILEYEFETIRAASTSRVSRTLATITTTVTVDGDPLLDRTWRRFDPLESAP